MKNAYVIYTRTKEPRHFNFSEGGYELEWFNKAIESGEAEQVTFKTYTKANEAWQRKKLKKLVKPKMTVYTSLATVSSSGMSRRLSVLVGTRDREIVNITGRVAELCGYKYNDDGTLTVSGCGMDMGFAVVYDLGSALWPKGTNSPHGTRNGEPDSSGGYAIKHKWI